MFIPLTKTIFLLILSSFRFGCSALKIDEKKHSSICNGRIPTEEFPK